ncbi:hypothetical protein CN568_19730 [Bacillus pseudomycoides]|nr:hypothetical protein bmyco0002_4550 [Bacillus pseudomycoides]EEM12726.1 hypothetical protein bmyco0003_4610 [Bacillus pseudomycoides]PEF25111.1 hypothetical protein CON69_08030 [Bacillus pseudomycoides]PEK31586.1 hypothetical protein CN691_17740 [Bacillus pseudomycoides]PEK67668.1 hypothetical protein CN590_13875 [Bacillus pseudomycoides]
MVQLIKEREKLFYFHKKLNFTYPTGANIQIILRLFSPYTRSDGSSIREYGNGTTRYIISK